MQNAILARTTVLPSRVRRIGILISTVALSNNNTDIVTTREAAVGGGRCNHVHRETRGAGKSGRREATPSRRTLDTSGGSDSYDKQCQGSGLNCSGRLPH